MTNEPPATSDSLLARANWLPAFIAASVGPNPMDPVIALRTTSHFIAASSADASGPSITVTPGRASRITSPFLIVPTIFTLYFFA